jgi:ribosomal protein S18 acetylase RimI-like enzyme
MSVRPYCAKDWKIVNEITKKCFKKTYDEAYLKAIVSDPDRIVSVSVKRKRVVGFAILRVKGLVYLDTIAVVSQWRRSGVGSELIAAVEQQAKNSGGTMLYLDMHASGPRKWYQKRGYWVVREQGFVTFKDGTKSKLLVKPLFMGTVRVMVAEKAKAAGK